MARVSKITCHKSGNIEMSIFQATQTDSFKSKNNYQRATEQFDNNTLATNHFTDNEVELSNLEGSMESLGGQNSSNEATDHFADEEADSEETKTTIKDRTLLDEE
ncbi:hypothetical protein L596_028283 [Steinernema carpocapsae]|uniref:Uncharacterized protein n=1 Tax=Steinernema carpocapsae TaxID=34508 RepID=A0A4U5LY10_STECR|nr:hypothetical protein L596_028283 [Steinernema carpocapsae]